MNLEINGKPSPFLKVEDSEVNLGYQFTEAGYMIYGEDPEGNSKVEIHEDLHKGVSSMKEAFRTKQEQKKLDQEKNNANLAKQIAEGIKMSNRAKDYATGVVSSAIEKSLADQYLHIK